MFEICQKKMAFAALPVTGGQTNDGAPAGRFHSAVVLVSTLVGSIGNYCLANVSVFTVWTLDFDHTGKADDCFFFKIFDEIRF